MLFDFSGCISFSNNLFHVDSCESYATLDTDERPKSIFISKIIRILELSPIIKKIFPKLLEDTLKKWYNKRYQTELYIVSIRRTFFLQRVYYTLFAFLCASSLEFDKNANSMDEVYLHIVFVLIYAILFGDKSEFAF